MWAMRDEAKFTLVSVAARSNFTSYYFLDREYFDADAITELRRQESALVMRLLGGRTRCFRKPMHHFDINPETGPLNGSGTIIDVSMHVSTTVPRMRKSLRGRQPLPTCCERLMPTKSGCRLVLAGTPIMN